MTECQLLINTPVHPTPADNEVVSIQMLNGGVLIKSLHLDLAPFTPWRLDDTLVGLLLLLPPLPGGHHRFFRATSVNM